MNFKAWWNVSSNYYYNLILPELSTMEKRDADSQGATVTEYQPKPKTAKKARKVVHRNSVEDVDLDPECKFHDFGHPGLPGVLHHSVKLLQTLPQNTSLGECVEKLLDLTRCHDDITYTIL
jgi:hypothetical protein